MVDFFHRVRTGRDAGVPRGKQAVDVGMISVIVSCHQQTLFLTRVLTAILALRPSPGELIVVEDGSFGLSPLPENSSSIVEVTVVRTPERRGPSAARNAGALAARGDWLLFVDSDVLLPPDTFTILGNFIEMGGRAAIALPSAAPPVTRLAARYKNSYMRSGYRRFRGGEVPAFLASAAFCRREDFFAVGGFDEAYLAPDIEDAALGRKLRFAGIRIIALSDWEFEHGHDYDMSALMLTAFRRSASIVRLILRERSSPGSVASDRTSPPSFRLSLLMSLLLPLLVFSGVVLGSSSLLVAAAAVLGVVYGLNGGLLHLIADEEGLTTLLFAVFFLPFDLLCHALGILWGGVTFVLGRRY